MRRFFWPIGLAVALLGALAVPAEALSDQRSNDLGNSKKVGVFLVRMAGDPAVANPATRPAKGKKLNPNDAMVRRYAADLDASHDAAMNRARVPATSKVYDYRYSYNGFAATLTPGQVRRLQADPNVLAVTPDELQRPQTDRSPDFLGLTGSGGLYSQLPPGAAGENIVVGVIDTGIWPEHPSFSDQKDFADRTGQSGKRTQAYGAPPAGWNGKCQSGEQFSQDDCNNKLIGARYFISGYHHWGVIKEDYESPRDADGHGSHTASTAAGNALPADLVKLYGQTRGPISGIAPRARVAMYKVCWNGEAGGCPSSDTVAAIDTAVADGVDVINYSIGSSSPALGEDDIAFLFAEQAGVVIAGSAGNDGPAPGTVGAPHLTPWTISVAASTHTRTFESTVTVNGQSFTGASVTNAVGPAPIVDGAAIDAVAAGEPDDGLCLPGSMLPGAAAGKIVLCKRGVSARVDKSLRVKEAGGVGMVLYNAASPQETVTDNHFVPSVHLTLEDGLAVKALIAGGASTASLSASQKAEWPGDVMAAFSSRGPNNAYPDLITPDVTAPGVNILGAASPTPLASQPGELFQSISGTSMSGPHVAGAAALLKQLHPTWSPAAVKSALMTSGQTAVTKEDGVTPADPFDMGAGRIRPTLAADPGLVYESGYEDYRNFLCTAEDLGCNATFTGMDAVDLNLASIGVSQQTGIRSVERTVTNVGPSATYNVSVAAPAGVGVGVSPSTLTIASGESATYTVTFTTDAATATFDEWAFGSLTWSDGSHAVRSPIAVKPQRLGFETEVALQGASGSTSLPVTFGYTGPFHVVGNGPIAATTTDGTVTDDPDNEIDVALTTGQGLSVHKIAVAGKDFARFALFTSETGSPENDLDLYVFDDTDGDGTFDPADDEQIGSSGSGTSDETVDVDTSGLTTVFVVVHGWQTAGGAPTTFRLFQWLLAPSTPTTLTLSAPPTATIGASDVVEVAWTGLTAGQRYLGRVAYDDGTTPLGATLLTINP